MFPAVRVGLLVLAFAACSPGSTFEYRPPAGARSVVFIERGSTPMEVEVRAFDVTASATWGSQTGDDALLVALYYDRALEELVIPAGFVDLATDGWPLPPPTAREVLRPGGLSDADTTKLIGAIRVARPPCGSWTIKSVDLMRKFRASVAVPLGDGVLFVTTAEDVPPAAYLVEGDGTLTTVPGLTGRSSVARPLAFVDEGVATVLWGDPLEPRYLAFRTVDAELNVSEERITTTATDAVSEPTNIVARRVGDRRTVLIRNIDTSIARLDEASGLWTRVIDHDPLGLCAGRTHPSHILELDDLTTGYAGFLNGPIRRFDLSNADTPLVRGADLISNNEIYCTSQRTVLPDGTDVALVTSVGVLGQQPGVVHWRPVGGAWATVTLGSEPLGGDVIASSGDDILIGNDGRGLAYFDYDPRRPDVAPRACGPIVLPMEVLTMVVRDEKVFVFGTGAEGFAILSRAPR